ncbi:MAG TPA: glycoside hydrolase domain-containing protein, partial [Solirubrobacterales bacterium]|nr:glycoside hydrolase domain-containing protein [Solirubrobacterales bacterium]
QAPTSACSSCAKLSASRATAQGVEAAVDAVEEAAAVAMGPGSPIYFDMESYSRTSSATAATLAFLEAWTKKLHELGYVSGVYSSSSSGIADLAGQFGTGYELPDHLWIANWNGSQSTADPAVPASAWTPHRRIHQYQGGHNETYGGVAINIDNDYVDAATVGEAMLPPTPEANPIGGLDLAAAPAPGQVRIRGWAFDPNAPTVPLAVRLLVGGREGEPEVVPYELGPVASLPRRDVRLSYPEAGGRHGFDLAVPTVRSGRQRVCAYAVDVEPGEDSLLGCKGVTIPVAVQLSNLKERGNRVQVRVTCLWPAGTECPGQIVLRSRFRTPVPHYRGRGPRTRAVTRVVGRTAFRLLGGQGHTYRVPLSAGGRKLLRLRSRLKTHVVVAIPGGRRIGVVELSR